MRRNLALTSFAVPKLRRTFSRTFIVASYACRIRFILAAALIVPLVFVIFALPVVRGSGSILSGLAHAAANNRTPEPASPQRRQREREQACSTCAPPSPRRIYAPAIELKEAERCELVLNSRSPNPVEVTPTFYTENGETIVGMPVQLQPAEIRFIPVEKLLPEWLRGRRHWGGIALSYTGGVMEVWAQITLHGVGGGSIDETFNILEEPGSDTREAAWWMPKRSRAVIALGNSSDTPVHATAQFSTGDSEDIDIAPFATKFIRRHAQRDMAESVKLTNVGPDGSLRMAGFVTGDQEFTSSIRFYDTKRTVQPNLYATNLRLATANAHMVLKNTSDAELTARPRFFSSAGEQGNPVELPPMKLLPQQIVDVDLSGLREAASTRTDLASVSAQISNNGPPGSLIGALYSTDRITQLTSAVPLRDSGKMRNATGSYPWRLDDDYSTIAVITNIGDEPARFLVEIRYPGGPYSLKPKELAAGETATFDLRKIRDEQQPDRAGNTLPQDLDRGQFHWTLSSAPGERHLVGRAEVVSRRARVVSSYSCPTCCIDSGPSGGRFNPNGYTVYVDGFSPTGSQGEYHDCYGNYYNSGMWWDSLWTNNTSVATINFSTEELHGTGAGETNTMGQYTMYEWYTDGIDCYVYYGAGSAFAPTDVPNSEIALTTAQLYEVITEFNGLGVTTQVATLNAGSSSHGEEICGDDPQLFTVQVNFLLPPGGELIPSRCSARPEAIPDQNYNVNVPTCVMDAGLRGHMSIPARRRCCGGADNHPGIRFVVGANKAGQTGTIDTPGTVRVLCNQ